jgi:hypothetical protein
VIKMEENNNVIKCLICGSREFTSRTGVKFSALSVIDLEHGKFLSPSVPCEVLANGGIEKPSMVEIVEITLEDSGFSKKIVSVRPTGEVYEMKLLA